MKPEIKQKWITALRSGEYKQGTAQLRSVFGKQNAHCCLGVLCDLAVKDGVLKWAEDGNVGEEDWTVTSDTAFLPDTVRKWAGLKEERGYNPLLTNDKGETQCTSHWNDDAGATFNDIANMIEKSL